MTDIGISTASLVLNTCGEEVLQPSQQHAMLRQEEGSQPVVAALEKQIPQTARQHSASASVTTTSTTTVQSARIQRVKNMVRKPSPRQNKTKVAMRSQSRTGAAAGENQWKFFDASLKRLAPLQQQVLVAASGLGGLMSGGGSPPSPPSPTAALLSNTNTTLNENVAQVQRTPIIADLALQDILNNRNVEAHREVRRALSSQAKALQQKHHEALLSGRIGGGAKGVATVSSVPSSSSSPRGGHTICIEVPPPRLVPVPKGKKEDKDDEEEEERKKEETGGGNAVPSGGPSVSDVTNPILKNPQLRAMTLYEQTMLSHNKASRGMIPSSIPVLPSSSPSRRRTAAAATTTAIGIAHHLPPLEGQYEVVATGDATTTHLGARGHPQQQQQQQEEAHHRHLQRLQVLKGLTVTQATRRELVRVTSSSSLGDRRKEEFDEESKSVSASDPRKKITVVSASGGSEQYDARKHRNPPGHPSQLKNEETEADAGMKSGSRTRRSGGGVKAYQSDKTWQVKTLNSDVAKAQGYTKGRHAPPPLVHELLLRPIETNVGVIPDQIDRLNGHGTFGTDHLSAANSGATGSSSVKKKSFLSPQGLGVLDTSSSATTFDHLRSNEELQSKDKGIDGTVAAAAGESDHPGREYAPLDTGAIIAAAHAKGSEFRQSQFEDLLALDAEVVASNPAWADAVAATPYNGLQKIVGGATDAFLGIAPLVEDEHLPTEDDLEVRIGLRRLNRSLHPISEVTVSSCIPDSVANRVAIANDKWRTAVNIEHESSLGAELPLPSSNHHHHGGGSGGGHASGGGGGGSGGSGVEQKHVSNYYSATGTTRGLCYKTFAHSSGILAETGLPEEKEARLTYLRAKQKEAEVHFGFRKAVTGLIVGADGSI